MNRIISSTIAVSCQIVGMGMTDRKKKS